MIVTRFAPSPNGPLHWGHAYSAIVAHDLAHAAGGAFLLRIEDIDGPRSRPELADEFRRDLEWLGHTAGEANSPAFVAPAITPDAWLGAAWVLAGSSLGNKMMERELAPRVAPSWPMAFIRDEAMPRYFKALRPLLESSRSNPSAEWTAHAVFGHFLTICERHMAVRA